MDDLTGALAIVGLIDLAVLAIGCGILILLNRRFELSAPTLGGAWAGFLGGFVLFLGWPIVPTYQIPDTLFFAVLCGAIIGAGFWLALWLIGFVVGRSHSK